MAKTGRKKKGRKKKEREKKERKKKERKKKERKKKRKKVRLTRIFDDHPAVFGSLIPVSRIATTPFSAGDYLECRGQCPGACGTDGSFYVPHDRFQDKKRDQPSFATFQRKIPPIGRKYVFEGDDVIVKDQKMPCRRVRDGKKYEKEKKKKKMKKNSSFLPSTQRSRSRDEWSLHLLQRAGFTTRSFQTAY